MWRPNHFCDWLINFIGTQIKYALCAAEHLRSLHVALRCVLGNARPKTALAERTKNPSQSLEGFEERRRYRHRPQGAT
jgi:hypothetical protein